MNNELGVICGTSDGAVTRGKEVICSQCGKGKLWLSDSSVEAALGIDAEPLIGMQADYSMQIVKQNKTFTDRLEKIKKVAAIF